MSQRYPISFTKKNEYETSDFRFIEVYIDVMHTGANRNKSSFTKEVIDTAIPSIYNTPILGYVIDSDNDDIKDFKGHEHELKITESDVKYIYAGQAYGVIPESCNPRWIVKDDGAGVEREYLRVDGLIWTKFNDPVDIFARDNVKNHSVELTAMKFGTVDKDGISPVTEFKFDGCCILSTTDPLILPAMTGSCIATDFSVEDAATQIKERLYEYQALRQGYTENISNEEKGDIEPMVNNTNISTNEEIVKNSNPIDENFSTKNTEKNDGDLKSDENIEDDDDEVDDSDAEDENLEDKSGNESDEESDNKDNKNKDTKDFSLTQNQLFGEINKKISNIKVPCRWDPDIEVEHYWVEDIQENEVIIWDYCDYNLYGVPYSMNGDNVELDFPNMKRKKIVYEDWDNGEVLPFIKTLFSEMSDKIITLTNDYNVASETINEMKPKLEAYQKAEADAEVAEMQAKRNALFSIMDEKLGDNAEYTALKANSDIDYKELEIQCYALVGRRSVDFSYVPSAKNNETVRFGVGGTQNDAEKAYGGLIERYRGNK